MFLFNSSQPFFDAIADFFQDPDVNRIGNWLFEDGMWRLKRILIYVIAAWILWTLFKWFVLEKPAWKYKDPKRAMKELNKLNQYDYILLKEVEEKSPLPEIRQAAREKNRLGNSIWSALQNPNGPRRFAEPEELDLESEEGMNIERGTLAVVRGGYGGKTYLHWATYSLPEDIKPSCPAAAEYRLELNYGENTVGTYTDGSSALQSHVKAKLTRGPLSVWEDSVSGGTPPSEKYWGSTNRTGTRADATRLVLRAVRTVRENRKRDLDMDDSLQKP